MKKKERSQPPDFIPQPTRKRKTKPKVRKRKEIKSRAKIHEIETQKTREMIYEIKSQFS